MTTFTWSLLLAAIGVMGIYLAGRKSAWGWALGLGAQLLWVVYAVATAQWGFILSAVAYGVVYARNLWSWTDHLRAPKQQPDCPEWTCPDLSTMDRVDGRKCPDHPCTCPIGIEVFDQPNTVEEPAPYTPRHWNGLIQD